MPIDELLRTTLKPFVEDIILSSPKSENLINMRKFKNLWDMHKSRKKFREKLWPIIVFKQCSQNNL